MDTIVAYIKGNATTDIQNFIGTNCPHMRNGLDCTTKFVNNASMCYRNNDDAKMLTQIEAIRGLINYLCAEEGQHVISMNKLISYKVLMLISVFLKIVNRNERS